MGRQMESTWREVVAPDLATVRALPNRLALVVEAGLAVDVRRFQIAEGISRLYRVELEVLSTDPSVDLDAVVGRPATFAVTHGAGVRQMRGIVSRIELRETDPAGYSTYDVTLVPRLWLATQRRNHRAFQLLSDLDIVVKLLDEWGVDHVVDVRRDRHPAREIRTQYGESDFAFMARLLEDAGIAFVFRDGHVVELTEDPQRRAPRAPIAFAGGAEDSATEHVAHLRIEQRVRPGTYTVRDHDTRRPADFPLFGAATVTGDDAALERYHYVPGAFVYRTDEDGGTPSADDRGAFRHDARAGTDLARRRLEAKRARRRVVSFVTSAFDVCPGVVTSITNHPHELLAGDRRLLVVGCESTGTHDGELSHRCEAVFADLAFRPPLDTPKPRTRGVESAVVVGPVGEEIHTDELGRVRVHFHWDRESRRDEESSCWIPVSQPWGGTGFGGMNIPRVGQEVLVDFLGADPDRPVVVGRIYTSLQRVPYPLPESKTRSGWRSNSSPGGDGFNELMFEDRKGEELVSIQAEKDLHLLVKHDENHVTGHDRRKAIGHDETVSVGNDRTETVGHDETISIAHDRTEAVANDERISIGHDRIRLVGHDDALRVTNDRTVEIGKNQAVTVLDSSTEHVANRRTRSVGADEAVRVGKNQTIQVAKSRTVKVGKNQTTKVGKNQTTLVTLSQNTMVGLAHSLTVGVTSATTVGLLAAETVGMLKNVQVHGSCSVKVGKSKVETVGTTSSEAVGKAKVVSAGESITLSCGDASIVLKKDGSVTIAGKEIAIVGTKVKVVGDPIELN